MSCSMLPLLVSLLLLQLLVAATQGGHWQDYKYGHQDSDLDGDTKTFCSWKCLLFTLQWPGGFCQSLHKDPDICQIPENINGWTIHGLWPQKAQLCCNCWPMFQSDIQELAAELNEHWPSLVTVRSSFQFWRDEWKKHGVCAACVEGMNSPLRYFQICLKLQRQFDFYKLLDDAGIKPSCDRPYKVEEVHRVLAQNLGNKHEIQCVTDEKDREVWFQVKIPLNRNLTVGCHHQADFDLKPTPHSPSHPCPPEVPFYYFPINHQQPHSPCG